MKKLYFLIFLFLSQQLFAQNTWVKTHFVEYMLPSAHNDSTTVGPHEISVAPDGTVFCLMQIDQDHHSWLVALDSAGNIKWQRGAGFHGGIQNENPYDLHATIDNGCIYRVQHMGSDIIDTIYRLSSSNQVIWSKIYYTPFPWGMENVVNSITQTFYNTTYIQFQDSLVEVDSLGQFLRFRTPFSTYARIYNLPDSNIIRIDTGAIVKEDFNGTQSWLITPVGYQFKAAVSPNGNFFYLSSGNSIKKIDTNNGTTIWDLADSSSSISITSDLGFVTTTGNFISKYDSSGSLQWTKDLQLPEFGLFGISETPNHSYVTGGTWRMYNQLFPVPIRYCPMMIMVDSIGNGVIDSTDFFWTGNANDNNILSFGNDAVYIAAALGNSGLKRDSLLMGGNFPIRSVYGTDWADSFPAGFNYKYSDFDGNGLIDTIDILEMGTSLFSGTPQISPHWYRKSSTVGPELNFHIANNHLTIGDTLTIKVTLGTQSTPVDSIYGLSFDLRLLSVSPNGFNYHSDYSISPTALGDTSLDLFSYFTFNPSALGFSSMVLCRNDNQNAFVAGDTIATIIYYLNDIQYISDTVQLFVDWNAITVGGFPVNLTFVTDSIFMSGINIVSNIPKNNFNIYPNPANDYLLLTFKDDKFKEIKLYDSTGRNILKTNCISMNCNIDLKDFTNGLYYLFVSSSAGISTDKFLISH